jgi:hypothetical protein
VNVDSIDLLVIPGGEPAQLVESETLKTFIAQLLARNKKWPGFAEVLRCWPARDS